MSSPLLATFWTDITKANITCKNKCMGICSGNNICRCYFICILIFTSALPCWTSAVFGRSAKRFSIPQFRESTLRLMNKTEPVRLTSHNRIPWVNSVIKFGPRETVNVLDWQIETVLELYPTNSTNSLKRIIYYIEIVPK